MKNVNRPVQLAGLVSGPLLASILIIFFDLQPGHPAVTSTAAIAVWMAIWWVTDAVPLYLTALLPVTLFPALGISDGKTVSEQYFNWVIFLFLGGFMVATAMQRWNLHRRIALRILILFGVRPRSLLAGFMAATAFLSMWISNTATTMMMVPIVMAVILKFEDIAGREASHRYAVGLLLGVAYAASIGGTATIIGTPPNPVFIKIFSISFPGADEISFADWFMFAFPVALLFITFVWFYLGTFYCFKSPVEIDVKQFREQYDALGPMSFEEKVVLADFSAMAILWFTRTGITVGGFTIPGWSSLFAEPGYFNDGTVAIAAASFLFLVPSKAEPDTRLMEWEAVKELPWWIVLLFGGGFALAFGIMDSGLSIWVGERLELVGSFHPVFIIASVCLIGTFLTELTSNTATAQILLPILASLAAAIGINPISLMIPATLAFSFAFMLPVATPPNAIVFGTGRISIADMAKAGFLLNLAGVIILTIAAYTLLPLLFGASPSNIPHWAAP